MSDTPVTLWLDGADLGYIIDALMNDADRHRTRGQERGGKIQEIIADHLDDLAVRFHELKPAGFTAKPSIQPPVVEPPIEIRIDGKTIGMGIVSRVGGPVVRYLDIELKSRSHG